MKVIGEYEQQAVDFLTRHGLEFRVVHIGQDCPTFCDDAAKGNAMDQVDSWPRKTHIHGHHYHVTVSAVGRGHFTIDFWNSYADEFHNWAIRKNHWEHDFNYKVWDMIKAERAKSRERFEPSAYDVFACLTKDDPWTFEDFCASYGYDEDSRKAESIYHAVQVEWAKVRRFFTPEEVMELQGIA